MKERLILALPTRSSFMLVDEAILRTEYEVKTILLGQDISKLHYLKRILVLLWVLLGSPQTRKLVLWFADYHAAPAVLLAKLMGKKSYVLIGGYDAVKYPEFGMGVFCSPLRGLCARIALRNCTHIIANHSALLSSENTYYSPDGHPEGIYKLIPNLATPSSVIFNAITAAPLQDFSQDRKKQILTVGTTPRLQDFYNKGYDLLSEIASRRPDLSFVFVGNRQEWLNVLESRHHICSLPNVKVISSMPHSEVLQLMQQSAVYAQPSISEGMPNALMEAMLMGCVPVGSNVAGIPTVMGKYGFIITKRNPQDLEEALDKAVNSYTDPQIISHYIECTFGLAIRSKKLLDLLSNY